jgi:hypothetical protein
MLDAKTQRPEHTVLSQVQRKQLEVEFFRVRAQRDVLDWVM